MKFLSIAQEKATHAAMKRKYKAVVFDIDGTLTELSRWLIPGTLCAALNNLPPAVPLAFCTGRSIEHIKGKLLHIFKYAKNPELQQKRWHILAENGGAGYTYNPRKKDYEKFFNVTWPDAVITQDALEAFIKNKLGWHVQIFIKEHSMVVRFHDWIYIFPRIARIVSRHTAKQLMRLFKKMGIEKDLLVQDAGVGDLIIPSRSGKGKAVARWAKHLKIPLRTILVIGDQASPGENDEEFLCGKYGTPFTVGRQTSKLYPLPVLDEKGKKLWGPRGTEWLLKILF
ncbi:MAG: HAD-IIB family hydrolase [Candidatus Gracilibacteria bacterium]